LGCKWSETHGANGRSLNMMVNDQNWSVASLNWWIGEGLLNNILICWKPAELSCRFGFLWWLINDEWQVWIRRWLGIAMIILRDHVLTDIMSQFGYRSIFGAWEGYWNDISWRTRSSKRTFFWKMRWIWWMKRFGWLISNFRSQGFRCYSRDKNFFTFLPRKWNVFCFDRIVMRVMNFSNSAYSCVFRTFFFDARKVE